MKILSTETKQLRRGVIINVHKIENKQKRSYYNLSMYVSHDIRNSLSGSEFNDLLNQVGSAINFKFQNTAYCRASAKFKGKSALNRVLEPMVEFLLLAI
jgi:hypothetical protein